jgi:hypothetical protein
VTSPEFIDKETIASDFQLPANPLFKVFDKACKSNKLSLATEGIITQQVIRELTTGG